MGLRSLVPLLLAIACCGATAQGRDTVYKSVGPDGKITYSQAAPDDRSKAQKLEFQQLPSSPLPDYVLKFRQEVERNAGARPAAAPATGLRMFSAAWCGYCKEARKWLLAHGVAYQELDIDTPAGMAEFARSSSGKGGVPLLVGPNVRLQGFSAGAYASALGK